MTAFFALVIFLVGLTAIAGEAGVDLSVATDPDTWACLVGKYNVNYAIIRAFRNEGLVDENSANTLTNAHYAGVKDLGVYIFPCIPTSTYAVSNNLQCESASMQIMRTVEPVPRRSPSIVFGLIMRTRLPPSITMLILWSTKHSLLKWWAPWSRFKFRWVFIPRRRTGKTSWAKWMDTANTLSGILITMASTVLISSHHLLISYVCKSSKLLVIRACVVSPKWIRTIARRSLTIFTAPRPTALEFHSWFYCSTSYYILLCIEKKERKEKQNYLTFFCITVSVW